MSTMTCTVSINGASPVRAEFSHGQEWIDVTLASGEWKPDLSWTHVDKDGHFHAYDDDGNTPTLRRVLRKRRPPVMRCIACNKKVVPGGTVDYSPKRMPGREDWTITIYAEVPEGRFSFHHIGEQREYFGFAERIGGQCFGDGNAVEFISECSAYPVAWRKIDAR